jgi:UDP-glucuronate 4-epimerase
MKILVTGTAGFIGFHLAQRLLNDGHYVYGIDNLNAYYEVSLKQARLVQLLPHPQFRFEHLDISDRQRLPELFQEQQFDAVIHLAAQAGVRYSLENPFAYIDSNLTGFANILECCRHHHIQHLVFASSSSVYGNSDKAPFSVADNVDHPVSLYAATKKANELMAHSYSHLYGLPTTGLRFFTVYGAWGRPDMAYFKFVQAIATGQPIQVYNNGQMWRDFTYIDDVVEGIVRVLLTPPKGSSGDAAPYKIYNIGNHQPVKLLDFIDVIEQTMGKVATKQQLPMQPGDVLATYADVDELIQDTGFSPSTPLSKGIAAFVEWYQEYYEVAGQASRPRYERNVPNRPFNLVA